MEAQNLNPEDMSPSIFAVVVEKIHKLTGITISNHKKTMLQGRLNKRMRAIGVASFEEYLKLVDRDPAETQQFINSVTTNETTFFRTPRVWEYFQKEFLPEWYEANPKSVLKIWSAAASSGEESYSAGMLCMELKNSKPSFDFRITGTDISTEVLNEAQEAIYDEREVEFLMKSRQDLFEKYFAPAGNEAHGVKDILKQKIQFSVHNLFTVKKEKYDIIFLRNVLIYFSCEDQEIVLNNISKSMHEKSILIIGESESLNRLNTPFEFKSACIYKLKG